jgi:uncharacterized damage-inducible protein DinB
MSGRLVGHFRRMARNNAWANHRLLTACDRLSQEELWAPRTSFFPSIGATLNHILIIDWYYIDALERGGLGRKTLADYEPCRTMAELRTEQKRSDGRLIAFTDALTDERLDEVVQIERAHGVVHRERIGPMLAHLFQHDIHHRGQVHAMLSGTKVPPPQLDEFFLDGDERFRAAEMRELGFQETR